jgi:hypothetical protein
MVLIILLLSAVAVALTLITGGLFGAQLVAVGVHHGMVVIIDMVVVAAATLGYLHLQ